MKYLLFVVLFCGACGVEPKPNPIPAPVDLEDYCLGVCTGEGFLRDARECFNHQEATLENVSRLARTNGLKETCTIVGYLMKTNYNGCALGWRAVQYYCEGNKEK